MKTTKALLACLLCLAVNLTFAADASQDDVDLEKKKDPFFAARGRRSSDSDGSASADDFFWANRGKRSPGSNHLRALRDQGNFNVPRPNGFFFPSAGKRASNYNIPRPNGFFFPSATGKRGLSRFFGPSAPKRGGFNIPRPNGFLFPTTMNKRGDSFNLPRPNGFLFPSKLGKRSEPSTDDDIEETKRSRMWNIAKPNGFFFPTVPANVKAPSSSDKRVSEEYAEDEDTSSAYDDIELYNLLSTLFRVPDDEDDEIVTSKRDNFDESTFFAGRGKRADVDLDAFFAGRGKKDVDADLKAFFAGRGKKGDVGDIFFAGRG